MSEAPVPSNMEGRRGNPYAWYRTAFNPRLMASGLMMGALPPGAGPIDRMTGNNLRNFADRLTGGTLARNQQDTNAYMRQLMRSDPGYEQYSVGQRLRNWARGLFGGGDEGEGAQTGPAPMPQMGSQSNPYTATAPVYSRNTWEAGGQGWMGSMPFHQFAPPSMAPQPLYGTGQGMMRTQPPPLYGTGQGMMRAPSQGGGGGSSGGGGGGGGSSGGGGVGGGGMSPGQRLAFHSIATRLK